jgi:hypothetical protein
MSGLSEEAVQEIEQIHAKWLEFETAGDVRSLMALCADDIELWPPDTPPLIGCETVSASMTRRTVRIHGIETSGVLTEREFRTHVVKRKPSLDTAAASRQLGRRSRELVSVVTSGSSPEAD